MRAKLLLLLLLLGVSVFLLDFPRGPARPSVLANAQPASPTPGGKVLAKASSSKAAASAASVPVNVERQVHVLDDFGQWEESYAIAGLDEKPALIADGVSLATERRSVLAALIESDPQEALRWAVPLAMRRKLPAEIVAQLEERVSDRGEFNVMGVLSVPGAEKTQRPIDRFATVAGQTYRAFVYGRRLTQSTRTNIPLHGIALDGKLAVDENPVRPLESGETPDPSLPVANADEICGVSGLPSGRAAAAQIGNEIVYFCHSSHIAAYNEQEVKRENTKDPSSAWTFGIKNVLFMRVNFTDDPQESISMADAVSMMNNASNWFDEVSYHATALNTTVTPLLTMPQPKSYYQANQNQFALLSDARTVAANNGFNTVNFDLDCVHHKYIFSGWSGYAYIGSKGTWLQSGPSVGTACHEFGHNYGLWHANAWNAYGDTIIGPGTHEEYGNIFDTMGNAGAGPSHFNACHKNRLGWLPDGNVATITNSGLYRIYAFDTPSLSSNLFYALKVKKDERYYWGELRSLYGGGMILNWSPWAQSDGGTHLLDTMPGSPYLKNDSGVVLGRTFSDLSAGIHLTPIRVNNDTVPPSIDVMANLGFFSENKPPVVHLDASTISVSTNMPATFTATASDPDGDPLAYSWRFGEFEGDLGTNGPVAIKSWSANGEYVVRCVVSDMKGGTASASVLVTVGSPVWYRVSGRILNGSAPLDGVRVSVSDVNGYTDGNGDYSTIGLSAGTYSISPIKPGWVFTPANFSNPVTVGPSRSNLNFTAAPVSYNLSGQVNYIGAVAGATVTLGGAGTNSTASDVSGYFNFSNLHAGVYYKLTATNAAKPNYELQPAGWTNPVALEWQDAISKNFQRPYYRLSGIVSNLPWNPAVSISDPDSFANTTPINGGHWSYNLPVPRGQWNLVAKVAGYTILPANFTNPIVITNLTPDQPISYNFNSVTGDTYAISGTITESGRPLPRARINAGSFSGFSDTLGKYVLPGLPNGNYQVSAALSEYAFNPATRFVTIYGGDWSGQDFTARLMFWLTQPRWTNGGFGFRLSGGSNRIFRIDSSTNLATWIPRATVTNVTGQLNFLDAPSSNRSRFYRAAALP